MADELIGGRYRLLDPLGRGSMSSVWEAEDEELERRVAVKMLAPSADRQRFEREARAAAALSHPNIVSVYDYGQAEGRPFMVLECLTGGSLEEHLAGGQPLPDDETRRVAIDVASGLEHAHTRGLVHRDLKPANILFDSEGRAKIADFGIARMRGTGTLTEAGTVLGTASYISPEQAGGEPAGPASDVYSFGVILFRMLTGRLPFEASNAIELVQLHRDAPPPRVTDIRADAPPELAALTAAALAKDPGARPPDGAALLAELRGEERPAAATIVSAPAVVAETAETRVATAASARTRSRLPVVLAAVIALLLLAGGAALALVLTGSGSGRGGTSVPSATLSLPTVSTEPPTSTAEETSTTLPTTTAEESTTRPATTAPATTTAPTTTSRTTTAPTTTVLPPTTTVLPPTTTATLPTTTIPTTTLDTTTAATVPLP